MRGPEKDDEENLGRAEGRKRTRRRGRKRKRRGRKRRHRRAEEEEQKGPEPRQLHRGPEQRGRNQGG